MGLSGTWLIDPTNFTIASGAGAQTASGIGATTLQTNLGSGNVSIATSPTALAWSANKLTLTAHNDININAAMTATSTASLALEYGQGAVAAGNASNITTGPSGVVNLPASTTNFTTKQGSNGAVKNYTVITDLGVAADATSGTNQTLQGMARAGNRRTNYALGGNIDASATGTISDPNYFGSSGFVPVGTSANRFSGSFDGLGHTISNLTIDRPTTDYVGLFGVASNSNIRNIGLVNVDISGGSYVGGLVGQHYGQNGNASISNSYVVGSVTGNSGGPPAYR
ncbi:MAG: hypothetical protein JZU63_10880, partial [Rhodoferax sp.]|nr:hypothetical protein [Rhodoferax sp.]